MEEKKSGRKRKEEHEMTKKKDTPMQGNTEVFPNMGRRVLASEWDTFKWVGYANWPVSMHGICREYDR